MRLFFIVLLFPLFAFALSEITDSNQELNCNWTEIIHNTYFKFHYTHSAKSPELESLVIEQLVKVNDRKKNLLTQSDAAKIRELSKNIFVRFEKKDCAFLQDIQKVAIARSTEQLQFAKKLLTPQFTADKNITLIENPNDFFKSTEEAQKFWTASLNLRINQLMNLNYSILEAKNQAIRDIEIALNTLKKMKMTDLIEQYFIAFSRALDPHSGFQAINLDETKMHGIGAEIVEEKGALWIKKIIPDGPAGKSGLLKVGDRITAIQKRLDMVSTAGMDETEILRLIRGPLATKVKLNIERSESGQRKNLEIEIARGFVKNPKENVKVYYQEIKVENKAKLVAILHIPSFYTDYKTTQVSKDVRRSLLEIQNKNAHALLIDLSTNPGGAVFETGIIGGFFIKSGNIARPISKGENEPAAAIEDTDDTLNWAGPLVILLSKKSASASEMLSASLKDYRRALIVGDTQSLGKGSFFSVRAIPRFVGAVAITGGLYFTPSGSSPQFQGVTSDIPLPYKYEEPVVLEKERDNPIPAPKNIPAFFSREANTSKASERWIPLKSDWIKTLAQRSAQRMNKVGSIKKMFKKSDELAETDYLAQGDIKEASQIAAELSAIMH